MKGVTLFTSEIERFAELYTISLARKPFDTYRALKVMLRYYCDSLIFEEPYFDSCKFFLWLERLTPEQWHFIYKEEHHTSFWKF